MTAAQATGSPRRVLGSLLALAASTALLLGACVDPGRAPAERVRSGPAGQEAAEVVIALGSEPDTLNPVLGHERWGGGKVVEGLVALGADLRPVPLLAEDLPEVSADGLTYTYGLRGGVRFHDDSELTAEDVVATYEAVDGRTVRFTLRHRVVPARRAGRAQRPMSGVARRGTARTPPGHGAHAPRARGRAARADAGQ